MNKAKRPWKSKLKDISIQCFVYCAQVKMFSFDNQMLAKLACGLHKPNKQTILPHSSVQQLFDTLPITKM